MVEEDYQSDTAGAVMDRLWDFSANVEQYVQGGVTSQEIEKAFLDNKFANIITVSKTSDIRANFVCSDDVYAGSDAACIQAALDHAISLGGGIVHINKGNYACTDNLEYTSGNVYLEGDGPLTVLDFSAIPTQKCIYAYGSVSTTNSPLAVAGVSSDLTLTVATGEGAKYSAGDWIRIRSEAIFMPGAWTQKLGEIQQIASVLGDVITLRESLIGSYALADTATIDKINMIENVSFKNFKIVGTSAANTAYGITAEYAYNVAVSGVEISDINSHAVYFNNVVSGRYDNNTIHRANNPSLGYGLAVTNASRDISGSGNHFYDCRHGITCGGNHSYGIQYNQTYTKNVQHYDSQNIGMFGLHPSYDGAEITGNICTGSGLGFFNGNNHNVVGNTATAVKGAYGIYLPSQSENSLIEANTISTIDRSGIYLGSGFSNHVIKNNNVFCPTAGVIGIATDINLNGVTIEGNVVNTVGKPIYVSNDGSTIESSDIQVINNHVSCVGNPGIYVKCSNYNIVDMVVSNNKIKTTSGGSGISFAHSTGIVTKDVDIKGNKCNGGDYGILLNAVEGCTIQGNTVKSATTGLMIASNCLGYTVDTNSFVDCTTPITDNGTSPKTVIRNFADYVEIV